MTLCITSWLNFAMTSRTADISADPPCHVCGYDLRAHPEDGKCPECGASVAESKRLAAIPSRPAWRDSDPRWRRRMLAGMWILVLMPLMDLLQTLGWASTLHVPAVFEIRGNVRTLGETFLCSMGMYQPLVYCIGVVLLFSKERGRRRGRLDWTRRWGVLCSYVVLLLSVTQVLFISALVLGGIAALFLSMPVQYQPHVTQSFVDVSTAYLRHGPYPGRASYYVRGAFSSITILLACAPLWDALRSSGLKRRAAFLLAPLAAFALMHLVQAGCYSLGFSVGTSSDPVPYGAFFYPKLLISGLAEVSTAWSLPWSTPVAFLVEATKWCIVLCIAVWLSIAQLAARRQRKRAM
jgi:hypothetical protein